MDTSRVLITDVSFYENPIDFKKMKFAGVKATVVRAGQNNWVDKCFMENWYDSKQAGLWRGSYWFWDSRTSPESQAKLWVDTMKGDYGELPLMADYEEKYNGAFGGVDNFKLFLEEVKKLAPNKEIMIYSGYYYMKERIFEKYHDYFKQYDIWLADYDSEPMIPPPYTKWTIWQFDDKGSGALYGCGGGSVDLNYFNGGEAEMIQRFNLKPMEENPLPDVDKLISSEKYYDGAILHHYEAYPPQGKTKYYVFEIDRDKADFFVSPQLDSRTYVPKFLEKYDLDIAINGDGFVSTTIAGFASSEGKPYGKKGVEETLYFDKNNVISTTQQSPIYNAISYPNRLVVDGKVVKINKSRDDIRGRTAFGYTKDQKKIFLFICDGMDYYSSDGFSFWEVADRLVALGCDYGVMMDSGGSTTMAVMNNGNADVIGVPCGEDAVAGFTYPMRRVANVLGIRMKTDPIIIINPPEEGVGMNYKVYLDVKARSTPSMYQVNSKSVLAQTTFVSSVTRVVTEIISGSNVTIEWVQMPDTFWLPMVYRGVTYVKEESVVVNPPVETGFVSAKLFRADGTFVEFFPKV